MFGFKQSALSAYETYSSSAHMAPHRSVFVSATTISGVRVNSMNECSSQATYYTPDQARALAAELIAAADSVAPAVIPVPEVLEVA